MNVRRKVWAVIDPGSIGSRRSARCALAARTAGAITGRLMLTIEVVQNDRAATKSYALAIFRKHRRATAVGGRRLLLGDSSSTSS